jgi:N-acetylmuramoyl-L-alanine amidase
MNIDRNHWLEGVEQQPLVAGGELFPRRLLLIHFTEGWADCVSVLKERKLSVHFVIQRTGKIIQCVPCNKVAFHAGTSGWTDPKTGKRYTNLNDEAIGIELENCGDLVRDTYPSSVPDLGGKKIPRVTAPHKHGGPVRDWEIFPAAQIAACEMLSKVLVARYTLDDVRGHEDVSKGRKTDPGPAFPLEALRQSCGFTHP